MYLPWWSLGIILAGMLQSLGYEWRAFTRMRADRAQRREAERQRGILQQRLHEAELKLRSSALPAYFEDGTSIIVALVGASATNGEPAAVGLRVRSAEGQEKAILYRRIASTPIDPTLPIKPLC